ncbi:translation initiation factor IF-2, partial [Candidatus Neomarinimicrobiota bacterium]
TLEAINHAKAAGVNIIVAINKIDKPEADPERVKRQLSEHGILVEDWGGKIQSAEISAKTGDGINDLMDKILIEAEMLDLKAVKSGSAIGTVIESRLDKGLGPVATVLVQQGTLKRGDTFLCGSMIGRVRALHNERGVQIDKATPSDPVMIQGFEEVVQAGERFIIFQDDREAKRLSMERSRVKREMDYHRSNLRTLDEISKQIREGEVKHLSILIKADVDGSMEALRDSFSNLGTSEVDVEVIHHGVGMVSENDVLLAMASSAVIIAFRIKDSAGAKLLAKKEGVEIRKYDVIYEAVNDVRLALEGLLEPEKVETPLGVAEVRQTFKVPRLGVIAGCYIKEGKAVRNAYLRVVRDGELLHTGDLTSLKRFKDDTKEVSEGYECGIGVAGFSEFLEGDLIEVFEVKEVKRTLA